MTQSVNVADLFQTAGQDGLLSPGSVHALTNDPDMGAKIQRAFGGPVTSVGSDEVILVGMLIDDSGSISYDGNTQAIRDGHKLVLDAFKASKQKDNVFVYTHLLNGGTINPFMPLEIAPALDDNNYNERNFRGTPLYDSSFDFLAIMVAEAQRYRNEMNITARTISLILTDGNDEHSKKHRNPAVLRQVILDLNGSEDHIVMGMGVKHHSADFYHIFGKEMGIDDKYILTPTSDPHDIRAKFQVFSLTAVRMSQSGALFSQAKAGGFGSQASFGGFGATP